MPRSLLGTKLAASFEVPAMPISQKTGQVATAALNEVTGQRLVSRKANDAYKEGWDRIFGKKQTDEAAQPKTESDDK